MKRLSCALAMMVTYVLIVVANDADKVSDILGFDLPYWPDRLKLFEEKPIETPQKQNTSPQFLRVFFAPCFSNPECFVLESNGTKYLLRHKLLSGKGGYDWGKLVTTSNVEVSKDEAERLFKHVLTKNFWEELSDIELAYMVGSQDGTRWWLEYWDGKKLHIIRLKAPESLRDVLNPNDARNPAPYLELEADLRSVLKLSVEKQHGPHLPTSEVPKLRSHCI
ncbi:MAG: hypothetical protein WCN98_07935 [Verrucomicrobiaceae bacterium]